MITKPKKLRVDLETFSGENIRNGLFKYTHHADFEIMLFCFKLDSQPKTYCIDLTAGQQIPDKVVEWIFDAEVTKTAWNAPFEIGCLSRHFNKPLDPAQWRCTMAKAAYNGYPLSLDAAGAALRLPVQKMKEGSALIRYFCVPCKPTKKNNHRYRNRPDHDPEKWKLFKAYGRRDVDVETAIDEKLMFGLPEREQQIYTLDQQINRRGLLCDIDLVNKILTLNATYRANLLQRAREITGLENPNSVKQLTEWLEEETDEYIPSLDKKNIANLIKTVSSEHVSEMLHIRKELSASSVTKFKRILDVATTSGHALHLFQYYGANRTGRWAGRGVQVHNLARNKLEPKPLAYLRNLVKQGTSADVLAMLYDSVSGALKELIRPAFIAGTGGKLVIGDFSAIEAVVLAWLSGEKWRLDAFKAKKDIYIASVARMLKMPENSIDKHTPDGAALRQRGKVAELALGYQGASGALIQMGALDMGFKMADLEPIVAQWRAANKAVVQSWYDAQAAFKWALTHPGEVVSCLRGALKFQFYRGRMLLKLPSGRFLVYDTPELIDGSLSYYGADPKTKKWGRRSIYGGQIIENATQAIARDLLAEAMLRVDAAGYSIVLHVHDELAVEVDENDDQAKDEIERLMRVLPKWAVDMPVRAEVFESKFYRKG